MDNIKLEHAASSLFCTIEARSDIGDREQQQDHAYIHLAERQLFTAVCDGMGGAVDGAIASQTAVSVLEHAYADYCARGEVPVSEFLYHAMTTADRAVSSKMTHGIGGTTLVTAIIIEHQLYWASVGDSRLYIMRSGEIIQATRDHNYLLRLDEMLKAGAISPDIYERELARGEALLSYLGKGNITLYDLTQAAFILQSEDVVLLTTDGLPKALSDMELCRIASSKIATSLKADALIQCMRDKRNERRQDNATFVLIDVF